MDKKKFKKKKKKKKVQMFFSNMFVIVPEKLMIYADRTYRDKTKGMTLVKWWNIHSPKMHCHRGALISDRNSILSSHTHTQTVIQSLIQGMVLHHVGMPMWGRFEGQSQECLCSLNKNKTALRLRGTCFRDVHLDPSNEIRSVLWSCLPACLKKRSMINGAVHML